MVCTTVTNTLVQNAISTLPARADGAAAGSGQQGRSSSEGRGAVVQDAEGSKQQPSKERLRGHTVGVVEAPSPACKPRAVVRSDLGSPRCSGPMCRAWGVWSLRRRSLRSGCRWPHWSCRALLEQRILSSASRRLFLARCRGVASLALCQRRKAMSLSRQQDGASFKRAAVPPPAGSSSAA